jgi:hypothetical protein
LLEALGETGEPNNRTGSHWTKVPRGYREILIHGAEQRKEEDRVVCKGITPEELEAHEACGFELPKRALLHQRRIRYFTDGLVPGSAAFVEEVFRRKRRSLGIKRKVGPRMPRQEGARGSADAEGSARQRHRVAEAGEDSFDRRLQADSSDRK